MKKAFETSVHIDAPIETVWTQLTDLERMPDWMKGIDTMAVQSSDAVGEGTVLLFTARGAERKSVIAAWSPPRLLALHSRQGGMTALYEYACKPEGTGTRLRLTASCNAEGVGWRLMSPLIRFMMKRVDSSQPSALKQMLETRGQR